MNVDLNKILSESVTMVYSFRYTLRLIDLVRRTRCETRSERRRSSTRGNTSSHSTALSRRNLPLSRTTRENRLAKRKRVAYSTVEIPDRMLRQNDPLALSLSIWNVDNNAKRFIHLRRYAWPRSVTVQ